MSSSTTVRLHWTDQPSRWHINNGNNGPEVLVLLDGIVNMHTRKEGAVAIRRMWCEHVVHPQGCCRIFGGECEGSM